MKLKSLLFRLSWPLPLYGHTLRSLVLFTNAPWLPFFMICCIIVENYVDDIVVKSAEVYSYVNDLRKVFGQAIQVGNEAFEMCFWCFLLKILRVIVQGKKLTSILQKPRLLKKQSLPWHVNNFMWRVSYVCKFIPGLGEVLDSFHKLLKHFN